MNEFGLESRAWNSFISRESDPYAPYLDKVATVGTGDNAFTGFYRGMNYRGDAVFQPWLSHEKLGFFADNKTCPPMLKWRDEPLIIPGTHLTIAGTSEEYINRMIRESTEGRIEGRIEQDVDPACLI